MSEQNITQQANPVNQDCPKCGGIHFGDVRGNCPLSADYVPNKPWPKAQSVLDGTERLHLAEQKLAEFDIKWDGEKYIFMP